MKAETIFSSDRMHGTSDTMCLQSLFEGREGNLEKLAQFLKLIMQKFVFKRHTLDTDSVSIYKKHVIITQSGRQVKPRKQTMFMFIYSFIIFIYCSYIYLLLIYNHSLIIHPFFYSLFNIYFMSEVERGRYTNPKTPLEDRLCSACGIIEDELHFLVGCRSYARERQELFEKISNLSPQFQHMDNTDKFVFMLCYPDSNILTAVGKFIHTCFQLRNSWQWFHFIYPNLLFLSF